MENTQSMNWHSFKTTAKGEECCAPAVTTEKPVIEMKNLEVVPNCVPGGDCC